MDFKAKLTDKKKILLNKWFDFTANTYPPETAKVLGKSKNKFDNPVGIATMESLEKTLDQLLTDTPKMDDLENAMDTIIRIRAIQQFTAAQAVSFTFALKKIVKEVSGDVIPENFEQNLDMLIQAAFNRYTRCREEVFLLRANEAKRQFHSAFERAGLVTGYEEEKPSNPNKS